VDCEVKEDLPEQVMHDSATNHAFLNRRDSVLLRDDAVSEGTREAKHLFDARQTEVSIVLAVELGIVVHVCDLRESPFVFLTVIEVSAETPPPTQEEE